MFFYPGFVMAALTCFLHRPVHHMVPTDDLTPGSTAVPEDGRETAGLPTYPRWGIFFAS